MNLDQISCSYYVCRYYCVLHFVGAVCGPANDSAFELQNCTIWSLKFEGVVVDGYASNKY